ncbi:Uncharacterized protein dnm_033530 [Desulfonema magnum]|uniref:Uncharacterized protein n=1 Tax=Desulfonema magnum TaxID=45655 RepID=A0A975BKY7_9BACT|nr:Uncharacterized protein dnm_033530 [Desulfonema magnum]
MAENSLAVQFITGVKRGPDNAKQQMGSRKLPNCKFGTPEFKNYRRENKWKKLT